MINKGDVIIVNEKDEWLGTMEKVAAHREGILHRAFSVFVLNDHNELLIQQRAQSKYHSGGMWSNTCCSHPIPTESTMAGAHRRLVEEMGFNCALQEIFTLRYRADVGNDMIENEYDHIFLGKYDGEVIANSEEVGNYKYISISELEQWMHNEPGIFTPWLHLSLAQFKEYIPLTSTN